jgi:ferrous iron transport protein B
VISFIAGTVLGWSVFGTAFLYIASIFLGIMLGGYKVITLPKFKPLSLIDFFKTLLKNILQFLSRISVGLVLAVTALYTLQYFNLLIPFTSIFSPIFAPIGLSSPSVIACLMFGLVAKEMIVGAILSFGVAALELTTAGAVSFILFALLYTPCLPALTAIKSKLGLFAAIKQAFYNFAVAYVVCLLVYLSTVVLSFII